MIEQLLDKSNGKIIDKITDKSNGKTVYEAWKPLTKSGIPPLTLPNCKGVDLVDYKIYGESVQNGEPTLEAPIKIESVGEKTKNIWDEEWQKGNIQVGSTVSSSTMYRSKNYIPVKPNTTHTFNTTTYGNIFVFEYDENKTYLDKVTGITATNHKFTTNNNTAYIRFVDRKTNTYGNDVIISEGNVDVEYEPYGYRIPVKVSDELDNKIVINIYAKEPLRKIGDNTDYIDFENSEIVRNIVCITKTAQELKAIGENSSRGQRFYENGYLPALLSGSVNSRAKSTIGNYHYQYAYSGKLHWYVGNNENIDYNAFVIVSPDENTTLGEYFTSMNLQTDVDFMYVLAKPLEEPIELPPIPTHKGTTIMEVDTTIQPSNMEVQYYGKEVA